MTAADTYEQAFEWGRRMGALTALLILVVVAVLIYSVFKVQKQRRSIRDHAADSSWEIPEAPWEPEGASTELDEWDRDYLAGRIDQAQWQEGSATGRRAHKPGRTSRSDDLG